LTDGSTPAGRRRASSLDIQVVAAQGFGLVLIKNHIFLKIISKIC
jgi:hypothetical protein